MTGPAEGTHAETSSGFWKLWEKAWWLVFLVFCAVMILLWRHDHALAGRVFAGVFIALALLGFGHALRWLRLARASERWVPVEATVVRAGIRTETSTSGVGSRRDTMTFVYPEMEFDYEYQGLVHRSDRIVFAEINWPPEQARGYIAAHPAGTRLTAWVDPERPERAVAERGLAEHRGKYVTSLVIAAILLAMGVLGFVLAPLLRRIHW